MSNDLTLRTVLTADGSQLSSTLATSGKQVDAFARTTTTAAQSGAAMDAAYTKVSATNQLVAATSNQAAAAVQGLSTRVTEAQILAQRAAAAQQAQTATMQANLAAHQKHMATLTAQRAADTAAQQTAQAVQQGFVAALQAEANAIGKTRAELLSMRAAQLGVSESAAPYISKLEAAGKVHSAVAGGSKELSQALRMIPAQMTDIGVSLAAGQPAWLVMIQQGGQLKDSFGGLAPAARAVATYIGGLVNPATLAAAAAAGLGVAIYQGRAEFEAFNKTIILSGGVAGVTAGQLGEMARQAASLAGGTRGRASEVLNEISKSSGMGADNMVRFTAASLAFERAGGDAAESTAQAFKDLSKAPLEAALKLHETTGFLTVATYAQIKALTEQGQTIRAAKVATDAFADAINNRTPQLVENIGYLERAWKSAGGAAKGAWDSMLNAGREETIDDKIAKARGDVEQAMRRGNEPAKFNPVSGRMMPGGDEALTAAKERLRILELTKAQDASIANDKARQVQLTKDAARWDQEGVQYLTARKQLELEIARIRESGAKAGASDSDINARIAAAQERFDPGVGQARAASRLADTKRELSLLAAAYQDAGQIIEATQQAGLLDEQDFFDAKRALIQANAELQVREVQAESARLEQLNKSTRQSTAERLANSDRIKDNAAKVAEINARAAAETVILGIKQTSAVDSVAKAYVQARQAAQDYLDTLQRGQARQLDLFTAGPGAQRDQQGRDQISDRYLSERQRIRNEQASLATQQGGALTETQRRTFEQQLALQEEFETKALTSYEEYVGRRMVLEADWSTGAQKAWNEYLETTRNVSHQVHDLTSSALDGGTDALARFLAAGKYTFNEFGRVVAQVTQQVLVDLLKIYIRQQIVGMVEGMFGGGGSSQYSLAGSGASLGGTGGGGFWGPTKFHSGGVVGTDPGQPVANAASLGHWGSARRHHTGLASDEYRAVLLRNETVLTPAQMRQLAPAGSAPQVNITMPLNVINNSGTPVRATSRQRNDGGFDVVIEAIEQAVAGNVASGTGALSKAMEGRYGLRPTMA